MFETTAHGPQAIAVPARPMPYVGPERRASRRDPGLWLTRMLDEVDYGMLLIGADSHIVYMNHAARQELDSQHPLQVVANSLRAQRTQDTVPLADALAAAQRGLRKLVMLGAGEHRVSLSVVPLPSLAAEAGASDKVTMLLLGKREICGQLSVHGYARSVSLTPAETKVLEWLCGGVTPKEIADLAGVKVSTVRTQIGSIRNKTGTASIRELVRQVAALPPLMNALRSNCFAQAAAR